MGAVAVHAPGQRGVRAKRLLIEKIAPAANALPDQKAHTGQIEHWQNGHPAPFADEKGRCKRADHRAVDGKPALPDIQHLGKALVFKRRHRHIERAPSQHRKHRADEDHIHHPVGVDAEAARITERKQQRQQHAGGDEDAIPVDRQAEQHKRYAIQRKLQPEAGECNVIAHQYDHSFPPRRRAPKRIRPRSLWRSSQKFVKMCLKKQASCRAREGAQAPLRVEPNQSVCRMLFQAPINRAWNPVTAFPHKQCGRRAKTPGPRDKTAAMAVAAGMTAASGLARPSVIGRAQSRRPIPPGEWSRWRCGLCKASCAARRLPRSA